jgi:hypothetical protein
MLEQKIYENIAAAITDKPKLTLDIAVRNRTWIDKILRRPKVRTFKIYPCLTGNMYRIAGVASKLPEEVTGLTEETVALSIMNTNFDDIVYIVAAIIQNNRKVPSQKLQNFIKDNFDNQDIFACIYAGLANANMSSFLNSIVLMRGSSLILKPQTNP